SSAPPRCLHSSLHDALPILLVRPSYVLGGQGMQIAINDNDIDQFIGIINRIAQDHPILVDKYLQGKEIEVDAVCDGTDILIPGRSEEHTSELQSRFDLVCRL